MTYYLNSAGGSPIPTGDLFSVLYSAIFQKPKKTETPTDQITTQLAQPIIIAQSSSSMSQSSAASTTTETLPPASSSASQSSSSSTSSSAPASSSASSSTSTSSSTANSESTSSSTSTQTEPVVQKPGAPAKDTIAKGQTLLHTPIAKIRFLNTGDGCIAKICRVLKAIFYAIFGHLGCGLGKAQDARISIKAEQVHIAQYERLLDEVVSALPQKGVELSTDQKATIDQKLADLFRVYQIRQVDIVTLGVAKATLIQYAVKADIQAKIEAHNQAQPKNPIETTQWTQYIDTAFSELNEATLQIRADAYLNWYANKITPENCLKYLREGAASYAQLFLSLDGMMTEETGKNRAVLCLRQKIAETPELNKKFAKAFSEVSKGTHPNKQEMLDLLSQFTTVSLRDQDAFLQAVLSKKE